jgi:excisionase family DNA binding protein
MATEAQEQPPALIDIPTAAARLGLGITAVRRKISEGEIPAYRMGGPNTAIRIDPRELEDWVRRPEQDAPVGGAA